MGEWGDWDSITTNPVWETSPTNNNEEKENIMCSTKLSAKCGSAWPDLAVGGPAFVYGKKQLWHQAVERTPYIYYTSYYQSVMTTQNSWKFPYILQQSSKKLISFVSEIQHRSVIVVGYCSLCIRRMSANGLSAVTSAYDRTCEPEKPPVRILPILWHSPT